MHPHRGSLFIYTLALLSVYVYPSSAAVGHGHHAAPLVQLNESEVTMYHSPTPPSYWSIDIDNIDSDTSRHPGLMAFHGVLMALAFFIALPLSIAMRSVNHPWRGAAVFVFYCLSILGCAASALYTKLTPNMYDSQKHSQHGYFILFVAVLLSLFDVVPVVIRLVTFVRSGDRKNVYFWRTVVCGNEVPHVGSTAEYAGLVSDEPEFEDVELKPSQEPLHIRRNKPLAPLQSSTDSLPLHDRTVHWANDVNEHHYRQHSQSTSSERTLFGFLSPTKLFFQDDLERPNPKQPLAYRIARMALNIVERVLVFAGFCQLLSGIVVYTGGCRENYINGCLAHLIKGGIFWCYGLVTFARFLGAFSELGWAWNRAPSGDHITAEFVESFVIFLYGITNTWMERFGANPGDPFTTKQLQHISIAVMFWFAGLIGMGIESRRVRRWLAAPASAALITTSRGHVTEPPNYISSFNPFPALVIGVTGAAMSAHAQTYLFQVQIHALWGYLLVGFAVLRCLTYFFVWLGPPRSILPSRPPTEALGSFFLACGGLTFIFSTEELTIAAMRRGRDDVMMFLNAAVAITCLAFCWTFCVVTFKGYLKSRMHPSITYQSSA